MKFSDGMRWLLSCHRSYDRNTMVEAVWLQYRRYPLSIRQSHHHSKISSGVHWIIRWYVTLVLWANYVWMRIRFSNCLHRQMTTHSFSKIYCRRLYLGIWPRSFQLKHTFNKNPNRLFYSVRNLIKVFQVILFTISSFDEDLILPKTKAPTEIKVKLNT